jgi:plastocyanin
VSIVVGPLLATCVGCTGSASLPPGSSPSSEQTIDSQDPPIPARGAPQEPRVPASVQVNIEQFAYAPRSMTIAPGTTVVWTNHDDAPHTVTGKDREFNSNGLDTDDTFQHRFDTPGTYHYFCALHPHMTCEIIVR